jgi:hypothetical protein
MTAGLLARVFPEALFVLIKRDIEDTIHSMLKARQAQRSSAWWSVKPPAYKALMTEPLWKQVTYQIFMSDCISTLELQLYAADRHKIVHYEDLCANPSAVLGNLHKWLGVYGYQNRPSYFLPDQFNAQKSGGLPEDQRAEIMQYVKTLRQQYS